jgi:predicted permease
VRLIVTVMPPGLARTNIVALDASVLGWVVALCLLAGILVGLAPAVLARRDLRLSAIEASRGMSAVVAGRGVRRSLVVSQFALSIVLLFGAGLLLRSLWTVQDIDPGFDYDRVLTVQLAIPAERSEEQRIDLYARILEQAASLPGVESAGIIGDFFIGNPAEQIVTVEAGDRAQTRRLPLRRDEIAGKLFETLGVPLIRGRSFSAEDGPNSQRVAIVNAAMSQRLWPGIDPVGRRFKLGPLDAQAPWFTIVGIAPDMRRQGRETEPTPQMFEPLPQNSSRLATLLVRTSNDDPLPIATLVQTGVRELDKYAAVYGPNTLENRLSGFLSQRRFQSSLLVWFAAAALLMAAVGIYGLLQYSITARTREIGIRMAVGAGRDAIFRMILREGLTVGTVGAALGLLGALWLGRAGSSLLFGVRLTDPWTIVAVTVLLLAVSAAACYFPARRAMKVQPIAALRQD